jgi:hypothetical protein
VRTQIDRMRAESQGRKDALRATAQAEIDKIKAKLQEDLDAESASMTGLEQRAQAKTDETNQGFQTTTAPINEALTAIRSNRDLVAKRKQALDFIETMSDERDELIEEAARLTAALTALEGYKSELLSSLPIDGLEVREGEIYRREAYQALQEQIEATELQMFVARVDDREFSVNPE